MKRYGVFVVLDFLGERVGQSGETAHPHPHRKIGALDVAGRDVFGVRVTHNLSNLRADNHGRTVAPLPFWGRSINLVEHGVIDAIPAKRILNGEQIDLVGVGRKLDTADKAPLQILEKDSGRLPAPIPDEEGGDEFGIGINRRPSPDVTDLTLFALGCLDLSLLHSDEAPNLVALDAGARKIDQRLLLVGETGRSNILKQMDNGVLCYACHTASSPNRNTVNKGGKDTHSLFYAQPIHGYQYA